MSPPAKRSASGLAETASPPKRLCRANDVVQPLPEDMDEDEDEEEEQDEVVQR